MPGLVPGIHVFVPQRRRGCRVKPDHDAIASVALSAKASRAAWSEILGFMPDALFDLIESISGLAGSSSFRAAGNLGPRLAAHRMGFHFGFEIGRRIALGRAFLASFGRWNERSIGIDHFAQIGKFMGRSRPLAYDVLLHMALRLTLNCQRGATSRSSAASEPLTSSQASGWFPSGSPA